LREQMKEEAEKRVRATLTLEAIAKAENIEVTEEEINKELEEMANMYNLEVEKLKSMLGSLEGLKEDLKLRKAIDFLVENSKVVA
jgi:trigger factor